MSLSRIKSPWVRNTTLRPSNVYAASPYRPYAGIFQGSNNAYTNQYNETLIRAISPFSVNDVNVIEAIRKQYNIQDNGDYDLYGSIGKNIGYVAGAAASYGLYSGAIKGLAASAPVAFSNPVTAIAWSVAAIATGLAIAGTIQTTGELGSVIGKSFSEEGSIAAGKYLSNLGNSLVTRPATTGLTALTIFGSNFVMNKARIKSPIVRQGVTMASMRLFRPTFEEIDNSLFGEMTDEDQLTYTDLLSLQGDLADDFSGTTYVKGALASIGNGVDEGKRLIAQAYGQHEDGFDPLDFADVRESWGIDLGTFTNGLIDILGEIAFDTDNQVNTIKNKVSKTISKAVSQDVIKSILFDEKGLLNQRYFKNENGKIEPTKQFFDELDNKKLEIYIERYLEEYKDPALGKTPNEIDSIIAKNEQELDLVIQQMKTDIEKSIPDSEKGNKGKEINEVMSLIKEKIGDSLKTYGKEITKNQHDKVKYLKAVEKVVNIQKKADQAVYSAYKTSQYNFDKGLLKEMQNKNFTLDRNRVKTLLQVQPALRTYVNANNEIMKDIGYFTRPTQMILTTPKIYKKIKKGLGKFVRKMDPFKKYTYFDDLFDTSKNTNSPISKEEYEANKEELKKINDTLVKEYNDFENRKILAFIKKVFGEDHSFVKVAEELKAIEDKYKNVQLSEKDIEYRDALLKEVESQKKLAKKQLLKKSKRYQKYFDKMEETKEYYKNLKVDKKLLDEIERETSFVYIQKSGQRSKVTIEDNKTRNEYLKILQNINENNLKEPYSLENKEQIEKAIIFYDYSRNFVDVYKKILSEYQNVLDVLESLELKFNEAYYEITMSNTGAVLYEGGLKDNILKAQESFLALQKFKEDIKLRPELTEQQQLYMIQLYSKRYEMDIKRVFNQMDGSDIFNKEIRRRIEEDLFANKEVELPINYATDLFGFIKLLDKENQKLFYNNKELFDEFNNFIVKNTEIRVLLDDLSKIKTRERNVKIKDAATKADFEKLSSIIKNKLEEMVVSGLMDEKDYRLIVDNNKMPGLIMDLINTHKKTEYRKVEGVEEIYYKKRFANFNANDMFDYVFKLFQEYDPSFLETTQKVDSSLKTLEYLIRKLEEKYINGKNNVLEKTVHQFLKMQMSRINSSKMIQALNSKYLRIGETRRFFEMQSIEKPQGKPLNKEEVAELEKETIVNLEKSSEEILEFAKDELLKSLKESGFAELIKMMGGEKALKNSLEEENEKLKSKGTPKQLTESLSIKKYKALINIIFKSIGKVEADKAEEIKMKVYDLINKIETSAKKEVQKLKVKFDTIGSYKGQNSFIKAIRESTIGKFIDGAMISDILRGNVLSPNTKIDITNIKDSLINFLSNNPPTAESITYLKKQPYGTFVNYDGVPVRLERISQLGVENLPYQWQLKVNQTLKGDETQLETEFFKGLFVSKQNKDAYLKYLAAAYDLPDTLRTYFEIYKIDEKKDLTLVTNDTIKKAKENEGEIINDIIMFIKSDEVLKDQFEKILISEVKTVKEERVIGEEKIEYEHKVHVLRLYLNDGSYHDFYIPAKNEGKYNSYTINKNEYIRVPIYGEDNKLQYLEEIKNAISRDFITSKMVQDKLGNKFVPFETQKEFFRLFFNTRFLEDSEERITDFVYVDPKSSEFTKFVLSNMSRLKIQDKRELSNNLEKFIKQAIDSGHSLDFTQSDPKALISLIELPNGEKISLTNLFNPLAAFTNRPERSGHAAASASKAIKILNPEQALLASEESKLIDAPLNVGVNAKVLLADVVDQISDTRGIQTYEDTGIIKRSFVIKKFGEGFDRDGIKVIDRHSSKQSLIIVDDKDWKWGDNDLILSKSSVVKRGLSNVKAELAITKNRTTPFYLSQKYKDIEGMEFNSKEERDAYILESLKKETGLDNLDSDEGYLYIYLTDDLSDNNGKGLKARGDNIDGVKEKDQGASLSIEEFLAISSLNEIGYKNELEKEYKIADEANEIIDYFLDKTKPEDQDVLDSIYDNPLGVSGKKGSFRRDFIKRSVPNSAYAKAISNHKLKKNQVRISEQTAMDMGIYEIDKKTGLGHFINNGNHALIHRSPTQGRRSFMHVEILINTDVPDSRVIETSYNINKPLNLDHDGDGVSLFAYKNASSEIIEKSKKYFSHNNKKRQFNDDLTNNEYIVTNKKEAMKPEKKEMKNNFVIGDEWNNIMSNAKVLKDFSGLFKNIFDADIEDYLDSIGNQKWFKDFIKSKENKLNVQSFYGLTTFLYNFYSQKSFDFSKHGNEAQKAAFDLVYKLFERKKDETFQEHITKVVEIAAFDQENYKLFDEDKITEQEYIERITEFVKDFTSKQKPKSVEPKKEVAFKVEDAESLKPEEALEDNLSFNTKALVTEINKLFKEYDLKETFTEDLIKDLNLETLEIEDAGFLQNGLYKEYNINNRTTNFQRMNPVSFLISTAVEYAKGRSKNKKAQTREEILGNISRQFVGFVDELAKKFSTDLSILKDIYVEVRTQGKKTEQIPLTELLFKKKESYGEITYKKITEKDLNISTTKIKKDIVFNMEKFGMDKPGFKAFAFGSKTGRGYEAIQIAQDKLIRNIDNEINKMMDDRYISQHSIINPMMSGKLLFKSGLLENIYNSLIDPNDKKSLLINILRLTNDQEGLDELERIFKPFFLQQKMFEYLEGNKRTNLIRYIISIEDIFSQDYDGLKPINDYDLRKLLIDSNMMINDMDVMDLKIEIATRIGSTDEVEINKFINILENIVQGLKNLGDPYGAKGDFYNKLTWDQKLDLITRIYEVKKGEFLDINKEFKADDLKLLNEYENFGTQEFNRFYDVFNKVVSRIENTFELKDNKESIIKQLNEDKKNYHIIDNVIRNANDVLSNFRVDSVVLQNKMGTNVDGELTYLFRSLMSNDNSVEMSLLLKRNERDKVSSEILSRIYTLIYEDFDVRGAEGKYTQEVIKQNRNKVANNVMALYAIDKNDLKGFVETLKNIYNELSQNISLSLTPKLFEYFIKLNEMQLALGLNQKILPHTIDTVIRDIRADGFIDSEMTIKQNNMYRVLFREYLLQLKEDDKLDRVKMIEDQMISLTEFYMSSPGLKKFGMTPEGYISTFFGKMLFENNIYKQSLFPKKTMSDIEKKKFIKSKILEKIKEHNEARKSMDRDETSYSKLETLKEDIENNPNDLDLSYITKDPEKQELIKKVIEDYNNTMQLEKDNKDYLDTFDWARYTNQEVDITRYSLFNIFSQLRNQNFITTEDFNALIKELNDDIKVAGFENKGPKTLHNALVDAQLTLKTLELILKKGNLDKLVGSKELVDNLREFSYIKNRKNFAVIDTENLVSLNDNNRIYEISYILFDEDGKPQHVQRYLRYEIDEATERWLRSKGMTEKDIEKLKETTGNIFDPKHNQRMLEEAMEDLKDKKIIGQNVKGDIENINFELKRIKEYDLLNVIKKNNDKEVNYLNDIEKATLRKILNFDIKKLKNADHFQIFLDIFRQKLMKDLEDKFLYQDIEIRNQEVMETYKAKNKALAESFVTIVDEKLLKVRLEEILEVKLDDETFRVLVDKYNEKLEALKLNGSIFESFPKIQWDDDMGVPRIENEEITTSESFRIDYNSKDQFSKIAFRYRAFYDIINELKEAIKVDNGLNYREFESDKMKAEKVDINTLDKDIPAVKLNLELAEEYAASGDQALYNVAVARAKKAHDLEYETHSIYEVDGVVDLPKSKELIKENAKKIPTYKMINEIIRKFDQMQRDLEIEKGARKSTVEDLAYDKKVLAIKHALTFESLDENNMPITTERFAQILGINNDDTAIEYRNKLIYNYELLKAKGIELKMGDKVIDILEYTPELDRVFKESAFNALLRFDEERVNLLRLSLKESVDPFKFNEKDLEIEAEKKEITDKFISRAVHNKDNEILFANERIKIKNMLLNEDWDSIQKYLESRPGRNKEKIELLDELKEIFYKKLETYQREGLPVKEASFGIDQETGRVGNFYEEVSRVHYKDLKNARQYFAKEIANEMYEQINKVIYVEKYISSVDENTFREKPLTYGVYISNLENYGGKYIESDYRKENEETHEIRESYQYLFANHNRVKELDKYQRNLFDFIEDFRKKNPTGTKVSDMYDIPRLFKELTEGYLSKVYELTIITDMSVSEKIFSEKLDLKKMKEIKKELPEKIRKLEAKKQEYLDAGKLEEAKRLEKHIENIRYMVVENNKFYNEEEISKIRTKHDWRSDEDIFGAYFPEVDKIKDTHAPTLKRYMLETEQDLINLINFAKDDKGQENHFVGLTTKTDLFKTDKISYQDYKLPKPIAFMQRTILMAQKSLMLMNHGFMIRNLYDGLARNYQVIYGNDDFFMDNYRFGKEAVRSFKLVNTYKNTSSAHMESVKDLSKIYEDLSLLSEQAVVDLKLAKNIQGRLDYIIAEKVQSIEAYLKNIIPNDKNSREDLAFRNYTEFFMLSQNLKELREVVKGLDNIKADDMPKALERVFKNYFKIYQTAGFFKQVVMNSAKEQIRMNLDDNSEKNVIAVKDELNLIRMVNDIEKSGIISDQYEVAGKQEIKDIYKDISKDDIDKILQGEFKSVFNKELTDVFKKGNYFIYITNLIEQTQRIHGYLLETYYKGSTSELAYANSLKRFFNYGMKSAYEKSATVYFPFISFAIRNLDYYAEVMRDPKYMRLMANIAQGMNTWYGDEDDDDFRSSNGFGVFSENQGWIPLGKNYGIKLGNAMYDAFSMLDNPFESTYQKLNPALQQINNLTKGEQFDTNRLPSMTALNRTASSISNVFKGQVESPADVLPSLFYKRYVPKNYNIRNYGDYRNIYRNLFFPDGQRRTPSRNPYTTVRNIRYQTFLNYSLARTRNR